jgi:hypothetical protein
VLLAINFLLFCGLCVFTHWLHVAKPFEFTWQSYFEPLRFWGEQTQNLNDFVLYPVSVERTPMHAVVLGLLVASIVAIPISVAMLYRFIFALPFIAAVFVFAHMPWMAITLVGCCILAAVKPFRLSFRFGAALLAMLPVILYLYLATRPTPEQMSAFASPDQRMLLAAPWVLAILAACAMIGVILLIARLVKYRPGPVAPVIAFMFATPAVLFHLYVGFDEVSYRVLETEYGPRAPRFAANPEKDIRDRILEMYGGEPTAAEQLVAIFYGRPAARLAFFERLTQNLRQELLTKRREASKACARFIADHPKSRYVPNVLYMQAWILDVRLDERKLLPPSGLPRLELYSEFPHVQSEEAWLPLLNRYPDSPLSVAGRLRLAQLHLRRGDVERSVELLRECEAWARAADADGTATQPTRSTLLRGTDPLASLGFDVEPYLAEARRWQDLISSNRFDPIYGATPLEKLAGLDPHRPNYRAQLLHLANTVRDSLLYDNLIVLWAASEHDRVRRAELLSGIIREFTTGDAVAEALYRLAELEIQIRGEEHEAIRKRGLARLTRLLHDHRDSYWADLAQAQLASRQPQAAQATAVQP